MRGPPKPGASAFTTASASPAYHNNPAAVAKIVRLANFASNPFSPQYFYSVVNRSGDLRDSEIRCAMVKVELKMLRDNCIALLR